MKTAIGQKKKGSEKITAIGVTVENTPKKPSWIRAKLPSGGKVNAMKTLLREKKLHTVCEEASCPNLGECFHQGTATFMILGDICTRRCAFCDVGFGRPLPPDPHEPTQLADAIATLRLNYVVITSVDRDDLKDGGAAHFAACIKAARMQNPKLKIEILVPDFKNKEQIALALLAQTPPDVFNHNLETVPRLYKKIRPGANYANSLKLLADFKKIAAAVPTKSGLMVGLGETPAEILKVMQDLRAHDVDMLTIGQYLQPSKHHFPVLEYVSLEQFELYEKEGRAMGFSQVASGPMVRSSYHAEQQALALDGLDQHKA